MDRLSLKEAAEVLGISEDGVRKRVKRGSIPHDRDEDGKLYVYLDASKTEPEMSVDASGDSVHQELVEELRDRIRYLEEESRRKDHLRAAALERIPAIEASSSEPESPEAAPETSDTTKPRSATEEQQEQTTRRSWWRRWFGG